jgi:hypothetical protein
LTAFAPGIARILELEALSSVQLYRDDNVVKAIEIYFKSLKCTGPTVQTRNVQIMSSDPVLGLEVHVLM